MADKSPLKSAGLLTPAVKWGCTLEFLQLPGNSADPLELRALRGTAGKLTHTHWTPLSPGHHLITGQLAVENWTDTLLPPPLPEGVDTAGSPRGPCTAARSHTCASVTDTVWLSPREGQGRSLASNPPPSSSPVSGICDSGGETTAFNAFGKGHVRSLSKCNLI